jgi:uncharacterized protein (TIGR02680 family)
MNNSRWKMHKIGLVDFWYYDEQEFYFADGRMLLRGANGSGKSVTMQSFLPLLLDGNMRPERLDPFRSKSRKMENYLLEEDDERNERTGYLYMELKRKEENQYVTIGIGIRARKAKKLECWYFSITDGRRIGKDFFLYKNVNQKIVFTKTELKNRIGEGGKVFESQKNYEEYINQLLFGFDTIEEYNEMLELLIQLRTPKLSKDFKPTIINDILGNSLQTLSEDDLRPMSEAIENMDGLKATLDEVKKSLEAGKRINRIYDQYNQIVLYKKAIYYKECYEEYKKLKNQIKVLEDQMQKTLQEQEEETLHHESLVQEQKIRQQEKTSLESSDATKLKEQELQLQKEIDEISTTIKNKEDQYQAKEERRIQLEEQKKCHEEEKELAWQKVETYLEQMGESIQDIPFDEYDFLKNDLEKNPNEIYDFAVHRQLLQDYMKKVKEGIRILEDEQHAQSRYDHELEKLDGYRKEREQEERELRQYEIQLAEIRDELVEQIYHWERENEQLKLEGEELQEITRNVYAYRYGIDESEIFDLVREKRYELEDQFRNVQNELTRQLEEKQKEYDQLEQECMGWKNKKDPEPEREEAVLRNREILKEQGIEYLEFYKTIDFAEELSEENRNRLEEAFLRAGILDALIVDARYRQQIFSMNLGTCDTYIFNDVTTIKENISHLLEVANEKDDIIFYQTIAGIVSAIGFGKNGENGITCFYEQGNYQQGILEGTITGQYQAKYIGVQAREIYRKQQIHALEEACAQIYGQIELLKESLEEEKKKRAMLYAEWKAIPKLEDLKLASKEAEYHEEQLERKIKQVQIQEEEAKQKREMLDSIRVNVQKICAKAYLAIRLDVFYEARDDLADYQSLMSDLKISHQNYLTELQQMKMTENYIEEVLQDMDDILYDQNKAKRQKRERLSERDSILEQLKLTNYEAIRQKLDECMRRISILPVEIEQSIIKVTELATNQKQQEQELLQLKSKKSKQQKLLQIAKNIFCQEYELCYVPFEYDEKKELIDQAKDVCKTLMPKYEKRNQNDISENLRAVFHENQMYLRDYQLSIIRLFDQWEEQEETIYLQIQRNDIRGKYRGVTVSFKELLEKLEQDAEEKTRLLNDKDREIFEDILANTISKKIRSKIQSSKRWVMEMNRLMDSMQTSSGLRLSLKWKNKRAETEEQMDTGILVQMLEKDVEIMKEEEVTRLSAHFRSKIHEARKQMTDTNNVRSFHAIMKEVLDYRKWFEFQLEYQKPGEKKRELTNRIFFTFSGGEKAMAMYVPLFSAVVAKYYGARSDAPRIISLDEAFAGVDEMNIKDMFRLMVEFEFDFIINSQILWGDYETVPELAIYQLLRPENVKYVTVISYLWNGSVRTMTEEVVV